MSYLPLLSSKICVCATRFATSLATKMSSSSSVMHFLRLQTCHVIRPWPFGVHCCLEQFVLISPAITKNHGEYRKIFSNHFDF